MVKWTACEGVARAFSSILSCFPTSLTMHVRTGVSVRDLHTLVTTHDLRDARCRRHADGTFTIVWEDPSAHGGSSGDDAPCGDGASAPESTGVKSGSSANWRACGPARPRRLHGVTPSA
jgi:hypothetical protein